MPEKQSSIEVSIQPISDDARAKAIEQIKAKLSSKAHRNMQLMNDRNVFTAENSSNLAMIITDLTIDEGIGMLIPPKSALFSPIDTPKTLSKMRNFTIDDDGILAHE